MPHPFSIPELSLALDRVTHAQGRGQGFISHRLELALVRECRESWLARLQELLNASTFAPSPAPLCNVPKPHFGVRPAALLCLTDQVVYAAIAARLVPHVIGAVAWASPPKDLAYQPGDLSSADWLQSPFLSWRAFREASLRNLDAGALLMLSTDITGYFEHISHELLISDLRSAGASSEITGLLGKCLARWSVVNGRGLPQGQDASHWLGKLYLNAVDRALHESGAVHLRYVDDIRLFCHSRAQAKRFLAHLTDLVRRRGLSLQSAKTEILASGEARAHVDGIMPTLSPLVRRFREEIAEKLGLEPQYLTVTEAYAALRESGTPPPTEMLREAYRIHFMEEARFEKTLFHFLLTRLGKAGDPYAADHVLTILDSHPEETEAILRYYGSVRSAESAEAALLRYLGSEDAVYPYQVYQIVWWRASQPVAPGEAFLGYVRSLYRASPSPRFLHAAAQLFLAHFGSDADLADIAVSYASAENEIARAECLLAMYRIEKGQRNAHLGKAKDDGMLPASAISLVRSERCSKILGET